MIEEWLEEYLQAGGKLHTGAGHVFIIYKGFKITKDEEGCRIMDVRFTDFYTEVRPKDAAVIRMHGFIKGCDMLMYYRDCKRIVKYRDLLEETYRARDVHYTKKGKLRPRKYKTALATLNKDLRRYLDHLLFFETRKNQLETKYNL